MFTYEFSKQVIKGLVAAPQSGMTVGSYIGSNLFFKYGYSKVVYGSAVCDYRETYDANNRNCQSCPA